MSLCGRWSVIAALVACCGRAPAAFAADDPFAEPQAEPVTTAGGTAPGTPSPAASPPAYPPPAYPPPVAPAAQIGDREPAQRVSRPARRPIAVLITGGAIFAGGYLMSVVRFVGGLQIVDEENAAGPALLIPIAGPWVQMATTKWEMIPPEEHGILKMELVLAGALQAAGAIVLAVGYARYAASRSTDRQVSFQLAPTQGGAFGGLGGVF